MQEHEVSFESFTGEFRFAQRDEDQRKSLVGMRKVKNLNKFFDRINADFGLSIPYQPTHVSLYTLTLDEAIGLNNIKDIEEMTRDVSNELSGEFIKGIGDR